MTTGEDGVRVVIADDHPMFRDGLRVALGAEPGIEVVAAVGSGADAVVAAAQQQPDVVVMDVHMPDLNGIDATRRIVAESPHIGVLVLTMFDEDESVFQAMRAGARGYLLKGADQADIVRAVRAVAHGDAIFGPALAQRLIGYFAPGRGPAVPFTVLTDREREVLELVARGRSNTEIARDLFVSPKTVRNHVSNIFAKLQVSDRAQAIVRAREAGLGENPPGPAS
ncbi:MAG TPA: response regulator transcription factor [Mycobacteriales bacterium]|jgi:DNA-binding NarL/FixJ family response regulator|nr:response regulator transcription factor [Mycobacteriales bacterium]